MSECHNPFPLIVYIAGYGRSGSTLLDILLGSAEGVESVGELSGIFEAWEEGQDRCACGETIAHCAFWQAVQKGYVGSLGEVPGQLAARAVQQVVERRRGLFRLLLGLLPRRLQEAYAQHQRALFKAISEVSGKPVILDSSKSARLTAGRPYALWRMAGLQVRVIHLVRDGRGVMWSQLKGDNNKLERGETDVHLPLAMLRTLYGWTLANLVVFLQAWFLPSGSVLRVQYEELVRDPACELIKIARFLNIDLSTVIAKVQHGQPFSAHHTCRGNRMRHMGVVTVREDREWHCKLPRRARLLYWLFGWPAHCLFCRSDAGH